MPEAFHLGHLREEAMTSDVEVVAPEDFRPGQAPDDRIRLHDRGGHAIADQLVGGRQPGRACTEDEDVRGQAISPSKTPRMLQHQTRGGDASRS